MIEYATKEVYRITQKITALKTARQSAIEQITKNFDATENIDTDIYEVYNLITLKINNLKQERRELMNEMQGIF